MSGREACRILEAQGFSEARRKGSHIAMQKRGADSTVTVIVPDHKELKIGTLQFGTPVYYMEGGKIITEWP